MLNNFKIGTKIGAGFALGLAILASIGLISYRSTTNLIDNSRQQAYSYEVLGELEELMSRIKDAENGQRGYLLTGEERYLEPYNSAIPAIKQNFQELRIITANNPIQQRRIDALEQLLNERLAVIAESINLRTNQGFEAARQLVVAGRGRDLMNQIRQIIANMEGEEEKFLEQRLIATQTSTLEAVNTITYGVPLAFLVLTVVGIYLTRNISKPLEEISAVTEKLGAGDLSVRVFVDHRKDEIGMLAKAFNQTIINLRDTTQRNKEQNWLKSNQARFTQILQGQRNLETASRIILSELAPLVGAQQGIFYVIEAVDGLQMLKLVGSYAYQERKHLSNRFRIGEGLVGQCALEKQKILLTDIPNDYIHISSGLGEAKPLNIIVLPVLFENEVTAVIELASFQRFSEIHLTFLEQVTDTIGIVLNAIASDLRTQELLKQAQALTQQLQNQQEELQQKNERLEQQAQTLQASEELLKEQQEELQQSNEELQQLNEELEEKAELLATEKKEVERKNHELEQTRHSLEEKAEELALSSKYKSEFLANMSHELRTPLNSLLILSKLLTDNSEGNLTGKQVEYSRTIYSSGTDLLDLINDILDLAKIESGTISVEMTFLPLTELRQNMERTFRQIAQDKGVNLSVQIAPEMPKGIYTDPKRLQQVLKNLLSNAFKFTERGEVSLQVSVAEQGWSPNQEQLHQAASVIAFTVKDTGVGIAPDKQKIIFEAFQQADGSTSRKYGGTGLGLSISREIARLLGGEVTLSSQLGQGSTFTFYLPQEQKYKSEAPRENKQEDTSKFAAPVTVPVFASKVAPPPQPADFIDDRNNIQPGDRVLLIIEDDTKFAHILLDMAQQQGFKCITSTNGTTGLALAQEFKPTAVLLDILLPGMDGWTVLDRLKHDPSTRHIPVHIMTVEEGRQRSLHQGAIAYLQKPISSETISQALSKIRGFVERRIKNLLVVEDDATQRHSIVELIGNTDVATTAVGTGADALAAIQSQQFDCVVLDLGLPDMTGLELIEQIKQLPNGEALPIIVYTGKEISKVQEVELRRMAETIIVKDVRSPERLLNETALFLHRLQANLPESKREVLEQLHQSDHVLAGKKVLIVDDDVRNIFALTSLLERYQMQILYAENGKEGIAVLEKNSDIDIVLMDVMMPELDGYETTRLIRRNNQFKSLPIIALTAKAMQGDRENCIQAGASDYITKPVNNEQLLSLLRVWLYE